MNWNSGNRVLLLIPSSDLLMTGGTVPELNLSESNGEASNVYFELPSGDCFPESCLFSNLTRGAIKK
jgi:hypothetical protein